MKLKSLIDTSKECGTLPLSSEQMLTFMQLIAMEMEWPEWQVSEEEGNNPWVVLIKDRLAKAGCESTDHLVLFTSSLCAEPRQAIMWAYTICHMKEKCGQTPTLNLMAQRFFPSGTPSTRAYQACWEAQQRPETGGNLIDTNANWFG